MKIIDLTEISSYHPDHPDYQTIWDLIDPEMKIFFMSTWGSRTEDQYDFSFENFLELYYKGSNTEEHINSLSVKPRTVEKILKKNWRHWLSIFTEESEAYRGI